MATATLTSKGQLTVPKKVRERLHLQEGDRVDFVMDEKGVHLHPVRRSLMDLVGCVSYDGPAYTVEEMDEAIGEEVAEDDARIRADRT